MLVLPVRADWAESSREKYNAWTWVPPIETIRIIEERLQLLRTRRRNAPWNAVRPSLATPHPQPSFIRLLLFPSHRMFVIFSLVDDIGVPRRASPPLHLQSPLPRLNCHNPPALPTLLLSRHHPLTTLNNSPLPALRHDAPPNPPMSPILRHTERDDAVRNPLAHGKSVERRDVETLCEVEIAFEFMGRSGGV